MEMKMEKPRVYPWFIVYCVLMCLMYLLVMVLGFIYPMLMQYAPEKQPAAQFVGPIYTIMGVVFFAAYLIAFFLRPTPGAWVYDLVLICLGMTSCCCLPITIPLLIFWLKPETKKYFGRS